MRGSWSSMWFRHSTPREVQSEIEGFPREGPKSEPIDLDELFLTDLVVHSTGTVSLQDYVDHGKFEAFSQWAESAIAKGWVVRPDPAIVSVTDAGRRRFAEIIKPVTHTSPDGKIEMTFRRG